MFLRLLGFHGDSKRINFVPSAELSYVRIFVYSCIRQVSATDLASQVILYEIVLFVDNPTRACQRVVDRRKL